MRIILPAAVAVLLASACAQGTQLRPRRERVDAGQAVATPSAVRFTPATSGTCEPLRLFAHGGDRYLAYGRGGTFARMLPDGELVDLSLRPALEAVREHLAIGEEHVVLGLDAVVGDDLYVHTGDLREPLLDPLHFRRHDGAWTFLDRDLRRAVDTVAPWLGGSVLTSGRCHADNPGPCHGLALQAHGGSTPAPTFPEFAAARERCGGSFEFTADPDGRILASGDLCPATGAHDETTWTVVRWAPAGGGAVERVRLGVARWSPGPLVISDSSRMFATALLDQRREQTVVVAFDGATWTRLPAVAGHAAQIDVDSDGLPWLRMRDGRLVRHAADGRWYRLGFPTDAVAEFGGLRSGLAWVLEADGALWLRPAGGRFARASLTTPEFGERQLAAQRVTPVGDELWVAVRYDVPSARRSRGPGCTILLRSGAANGPDAM